MKRVEMRSTRSRFIPKGVIILGLAAFITLGVRLEVKVPGIITPRTIHRQESDDALFIGQDWLMDGIEPVYIDADFYG